MKHIWTGEGTPDGYLYCKTCGAIRCDKTLNAECPGKPPRIATRKPEKKVVWFASGGGIRKAGPYATQVAAVNAMRLVRKSKFDPVFPDDIFVWPEEVE